MSAIAGAVLSGLCLVAAAYAASEAEKAVGADAFVDSVGVNVHLHYTDTSYGNFAAVEKAIKDLKVRHIRDGLTDTSWTAYYDRLNELGRAGVKAIQIASPNQNGALFTAYPARVADSFEGYEAPNEYDQIGGKDWAGTINGFMARLYQAVRGDPRTAKFPIVGPSLTQGESFSKVADTARFFDFANLHNYWGGRNPGTHGWGANGYGSYEWNLNLTRTAWAEKPIFTTETGYFNDVSKADGVPEDVAGKYLPRLLFLQWMHGIQRTYVYELLDVGDRQKFGDATYGLLRANFTPKPAYTAVRSVMQLLADPGPAFAAGNLDFSLSGDLKDVDHLLLEKRNGTFFLAIWIEELGWDVDRRTAMPVAGRQIVVRTRDAVKITLHRLGKDGEMASSELRVGVERSVEIGDRVMILEISR
jgi:hypothetical protein